MKKYENNFFQRKDFWLKKKWLIFYYMDVNFVDFEIQSDCKRYLFFFIVVYFENGILSMFFVEIRNKLILRIVYILFDFYMFFFG